jgi:hypothetical protein
LTIRSIEPDPRGAALTDAASHLDLWPSDGERFAVSDVVFVEGDLSPADLDALHGLLCDPLLQTARWELPTGPGVEITFLPGVTDTAAASVVHGAAQLGVAITGAATGRRVELGPSVDPAAVPRRSCAGSSPTR